MHRSAAKEKELGQAIEVQRGKREEAERELAGSRARLDQLTSQYAEVEARLGQAESEGRGHAGQVQKRTNQVAALQKAVEQWQQRVASLEESLTKERVRESPCNLHSNEHFRSYQIYNYSPNYLSLTAFPPFPLGDSE